MEKKRGRKRLARDKNKKIIIYGSYRSHLKENPKSPFDKAFKQLKFCFFFKILKK